MADSDTKLIIQIDTILRGLDKTLRGLSAVEKRLRTVASIKPGSQAGVNQAIAAAKRLEQQQRRLVVQSQELANREERARLTVDRLALARQRLALATARQAAAEARFAQTLNRQNQLVERAQRGLNAFGGALLRIGGGLRSLGATASVLIAGPLAALGAIAARSAADIDTIRNRLVATEGSLEAANKRLDELRKLADASIGVTRRSALETFASLSVIGGITEKTIERQIKALGRLNAAFTIEDQQQFFRNLVQIFSQGFERADIKEALGRIPIFNQLLQSAFGTSDPARLRELKAAGKLTLDTFLAGLATAVETDPTLNQIGESIRTRFAKTFERLTDALEPLGRAILGPLERIITAVEPIILRLAESFNQLSPGVQTAIVALGILAAALGPLLFVVGGIASGLGGLATALAVIAPLIGSIGLPAVLAVLAGIAVLVGEIATVAFVLFKAWQTNFLGVQELVGNVANAVLRAFNRIRSVIDEVVQRILPTLQSLTSKVLNNITRLWEMYGKQVVKIVGDAFEFVVGVIETFIRTVGNFVDLLLKLIDGDFRGAWQAFARIVVDAVKGLDRALGAIQQIVQQAFILILGIIINSAVRFVKTGRDLGSRLIAAMVTEIAGGGPKIRNALVDVLTSAVAGLDPSNVAAVLVAKLIDAIQRAAREGVVASPTLTVGIDPTGATGIFRPKRTTRSSGTTEEAAKKAKKEHNFEVDLLEAQNAARIQAEANRIALVRAAIEHQFELTKDGLDRELTALRDNFEDRIVAVKAYFAERRRLQEADIDAELIQQKSLSAALVDEFTNRRAEIDAEAERAAKKIRDDKTLTGRNRILALQTVELKRQTDLSKAQNEFETKNADVSTRILILQQQRRAAIESINREERQLTAEITRQQEVLSATLLEEQGRTVEAAGARLRAQFLDAIADLRVDLASLPRELQQAVVDVDLSTLKQRLDELPEPVRLLINLLEIGIQRALIAEQVVNVDRALAELRIREIDIQNKVADGVLVERDARQQILAVQQRYRAVLLDILGVELARAKAIDDADEVLRIQGQIQEIQRLGREIDEVGQRINRELFGTIQQGFEGIFEGARKGIDGLRDALVSFGESVLGVFNRLAAESLTQKLEGIFKPDATDTTGTPGGFLARLFGLKPDPGGAALATAGTTAGSAMATGGAAAGAALTTGGVTAGTTLAASVITAAASFTASVVAAGAAFAAAVATAAGVDKFAGLGGNIGFARGDIIQPHRQGVLARIAEAGHAEAVLTTDPKHALRQVAILREFLRRATRVRERIQSVPEFAAGALITPHQAEMRLLDSMQRPPSIASDVTAMSVGGDHGMSLRIMNLFDKQAVVSGYMRSAEGRRDILNIVSEHGDEIGRRIGVK